MVQILFMDDMKSDEEVDHNKVMELLSKAPNRKFDSNCIILHGETYSIDDMKSIMPKE